MTPTDHPEGEKRSESRVRPDVIRAWRLCIEHKHEPQPRLGQFNWPWALGLALDEIERLNRRIDAALAWAHEANPDPVRNGDLFADLRAALAAESFGVQPSREGD